MQKEFRGLVNALGMVVLIILVALLLFYFALSLWFGLLLSPLGLVIEGDRDGIVLLAVPLTALLGGLLPSWLPVIARFCRLDRIAALHMTRVGPYLPLLVAGALVGLFAFLAWVLSFPYGASATPAGRFGCAVLSVVCVGVGINLYPRVFATLAGALAGPAGLSLIAFLGMRASSRVETFLKAPDGPLAVVLIVVSVLVGCALVAAAAWLRVRNSSPPPWTSSKSPAACPRALFLASAAWAAGVMVIPTVTGLVFPLVSD